MAIASMHPHASLTRLAIAALLLASALGVHAREHDQEVELSDDQFKKLDQFEAFALQKADKVFEKDKRQAAAEYDAFILDNPRSKALPYALLRKARSMQLANKRNAALKEYQELIDFLPDQADFAGAALFYIGQCHWDDGNPERALQAWAKMAAHPAYSKHFLAATALSRLADGYMKQGNAEKAMEYCAISAINFRKSNPEAARHAITNQVIPYYIRTAPNESKLREFYLKVGAFERDPHKVEPDATKDRRYWEKIIELVDRHGRFTEEEEALKKNFYAYWAKVFEGKFADWDDFQLNAALWQLRADGDSAKYIARLDDQFSKYQKDGDFTRIVKWVRWVARDKAKVQQYYAKLDFAKMNNKDIRELMEAFFDDVKDTTLAKNVFNNIRLSQVSEREKGDLARYLWHRDETLVRKTCQEMQQPAGQMELLRYLHFRRFHEEAVTLADQLKGVPEYAKDATWLKGEMLQDSKQYEKAIATFREADNPPDNLFRMAECQHKLGKPDLAVKQLQEIQNFFKDQAAEAALRTAWIHRDGGDKAKFEASLRAVLNKYPKSGQSSKAHEELEKMGVRIGGGVNAD